MDRQHQTAEGASNLAELTRVWRDPAIRSLAMRRAGSYEVAEDALQETYYLISRLKHLEEIENLRAYFCMVLMRVIYRIHREATSEGIPVYDIGRVQETSRLQTPPTSLEDDISQRLHIEGVLTRLQSDYKLLMKSIPGRSDNPDRYRLVIAEVAEQILLAVVAEDGMSSGDWNKIFRDQYPQWWDEPGLDRAVLDQRLSRARRDVRDLLKRIIA